VASIGPKYKHICHELRSAIDSGVYIAGYRLPSEHEMVQSYGASRVTVSRALRELQVEGYVERRAGSGTYVCRSTAKQHTFGLLIPELGQTEIFEPICQGMAAAQQAQNHVLLWGKSLAGSETTNEEAKDVCSRLIASRVSGVFFAPLESNPQKDAINSAIATMLTDARIPIILLDRDIFDYPRRSRFDVVGIDNRRAGYVLTQHLIAAGARRIAFIGRPHLAPSCVARSSGYRDAVVGATVEMAPPFVEQLEPSDTVRVSSVLERYRPDGIVCSNDRTAAVLMRTLADLGVSIPQQVRLAAFDDVKYANVVSVPLTTVHQPCDQLGAAAVQTMLQRIENHDMPARDVLVDFWLVVRDSCGSKAGPGSSLSFSKHSMVSD
jgi:GntR family transcriptional regulator of arabinose operon